MLSQMRAEKYKPQNILIKTKQFSIEEIFPEKLTKFSVPIKLSMYFNLVNILKNRMFKSTNNIYFVRMTVISIMVNDTP